MDQLDLDKALAWHDIALLNGVTELGYGDGLSLCSTLELEIHRHATVPLGLTCY